MSTHKFKVLKPFSVVWLTGEIKLGEEFEIIAVDTWHEVRGVKYQSAYYRIGAEMNENPHFSGLRLDWLTDEDNMYLEEI
jgi:hypothetical protein